MNNEVTTQLYLRGLTDGDSLAVMRTEDLLPLFFFKSNLAEEELTHNLLNFHKER